MYSRSISTLCDHLSHRPAKHPAVIKGYISGCWAVLDSITVSVCVACAAYQHDLI